MSDMEKIVFVSLLLVVATVSTVWLIIRAQRHLRQRAEAALAQLCRLRWLILNSDGVLLVWDTLDTEWESAAAVVEKAFSLGTTLCRS